MHRPQDLQSGPAACAEPPIPLDRIMLDSPRPAPPSPEHTPSRPMSRSSSASSGLLSSAGPDSDSETGVGEQLPETAMSTGAAAARRLYVSHSLSTWNARVFEFGSVLYLAALFPGTLLPMSVYALVRGLAAVLCTSLVGSYIDTGDRLKVVRLSIVLQRVAVGTSCAAFYVLATESTLPLGLSVSLLVVLCLLACVEKVAADMNMTAVETDWVPAMCNGDQSHAKFLNAKLRRIDLVCKLIGPLFIGSLDATSTKLAILVNLGMNFLSIPLEYFTIATVYHQDPNLQRPKHSPPPPPPSSSSPSSPPTFPEDVLPPAPTTAASVVAAARRTRADFAMHLAHAASLPSFARALTYLTVLSFSGRMVTYLLATGYSSAEVGAWRAASVVFEVAATWLAPWLMGRLGSVRAALWFSSWQVVWLALGLGCSWTLDERGGQAWVFWSALALVVGTVLSRVGLVGFDLSVENIIQADVDEDIRGTFTQVEKAYQNAFEMVSYVTTLVFTRPDEFKWPSLISFLGIFGAWYLQAVFVRQRRGHLLHFSGAYEKAVAGFSRQGTGVTRLGGPWRWVNGPAGITDSAQGLLGQEEEGVGNGD